MSKTHIVLNVRDKPTDLQAPIKDTNRLYKVLFIADSLKARFYYERLIELGLSSADLNVLVISHQYSYSDNTIKSNDLFNIYRLTWAYKPKLTHLKTVLECGYLVCVKPNYYRLSVEGYKLVLTWYEYVEYFMEKHQFLFK